ncbi:hypothetical protein [Paenibacillus amylolyticus]|uniref:hypothetical protein n=1 Tax=Paenibacillus amylolyticus TaxID=1451 RepID=UPI001C4F0A10|nr:hypothetical protein [Paenibacillus amylolyticus]
MNFGWFDQDTEESEFERTVMHEFGHALGCIHEHQTCPSTLGWPAHFGESYNHHMDY